MKRKTEIRHVFGVFWTYPFFFWKECCNCHKEFRRENGYSTWSGYNRLTRLYLCNECAKSKEEAHKIFAKRSWIKRPKGPLPPPPPPPKRLIIEGRKITCGGK